MSTSFTILRTTGNLIAYIFDFSFILKGYFNFLFFTRADSMVLFFGTVTVGHIRVPHET